MCKIECPECGKIEHLICSVMNSLQCKTYKRSCPDDSHLVKCSECEEYMREYILPIICPVCKERICGSKCFNEHTNSYHNRKN